MNAVPITFSHCAAIEGDYYMIASKPNALYSDEKSTRIFYFDARAANTWRHTDIAAFAVADICVVRRTFGQRRYAVLSKEGEIVYFWPGDQWAEKIDGAGLERPGPVFGCLNALREINGVLYACGGGGQIYRRDDSGWRDIAGALRKSTPVLSANLALQSPELGDDIADMGGYAADDLYAVGRNGLCHYDGLQWRACEVSTDQILVGMVCAPGGVVWACGFNGAVMRGNAAEGFKDVSHYDDNMILTSLALFDGKLYLSSNQGLFQLDPERIKARLVKVEGISECDDLSAAGEVLLCVGPKNIYRLEAGSWKELMHPDN